jgi:hypothetical protein
MHKQVSITSKMKLEKYTNKNMNGAKSIIIYALGLFILFALIGTSASIVKAAEYSVNMTSTQNYATAPDSAMLKAKSLKYDPYPANAGDLVDVWLMVENDGKADAPNATFRLVPQYPFSVDNNDVLDYGVLNGLTNALSYRLPDENAPQSNQVLLKYRIKIADDASDGVETLKLMASIDGEGSASQIFEFPITIRKTKTDFEISFQQYANGRLIIETLNNGDKTASAVTVAISSREKYLVEGKTAETLGNLKPGDFTDLSFYLKPLTTNNDTISTLHFDISYTDEAGNRITVQKSVPVNVANDIEKQTENATGIKSIYDNKYVYFVFGLVGIVLGILLAVLLSGKRKD